MGICLRNGRGGTVTVCERQNTSIKAMLDVYKSEAFYGAQVSQAVLTAQLRPNEGSSSNAMLSRHTHKTEYSREEVSAP